MTGKQLRIMIYAADYKQKEIAEALGMTPYGLRSAIRGEKVKGVYIHAVKRVLETGLEREPPLTGTQFRAMVFGSGMKKKEMASELGITPVGLSCIFRGEKVREIYNRAVRRIIDSRH